MAFVPIHLEALPRRGRGVVNGGVLWEEPVAAALLIIDPRQTNRAGFLAFFHCANDEESLDRLLGVAYEEASHHGVYRLIGPTGVSPHLGSGVLENFFHVTPPLHTPYNPPYIPETINSSLKRWKWMNLFQLSLPSMDHKGDQQSTPVKSTKIVSIIPLSNARALSDEFLPLWREALYPESLFTIPDQEEIHFLWQWLTVWPWAGWVLMVDQRPVSFVLLQPDLAEQSRMAQGGRSPLWAWWLRWRSHRTVESGRLLFAGTLPEWRDEELEELLWQYVIRYANEQGWHTLTIGPLLEREQKNKFGGERFLATKGSIAQQKYILYASEL